MTYELEDLNLMEISAVDAGANQHASVVLFKRSGYTSTVKSENTDETTRGDGSVTVEELTTQLEALQEQVADLTKKAEDADTAKIAAEEAAAALLKSAEDAGLDIEDGKIVKRADPDYVEVNGEKVEKSLVPAPVLKAIEAQAAEIAKMKAKAEEVELAKRGETELPNLGGTALAKGRLLKSVGDDADLLKALKAADTAMAAAYTEKGHANDFDADEPGVKLNKMAKDYAVEKGIPFESAYSEIIKDGEGASLLRQMRETAN
jgi:hypothetical protein